MKTDSAARLYSNQFLHIVQLQNAGKASPLRSVKHDASLNNQPPAELATNPSFWDERWFANYE